MYVGCSWRWHYWTQRSRSFMKTPYASSSGIYIPTSLPTHPSTHLPTYVHTYSLYGHKLPVMAMDISDDNDIIATASADKTVKIWGLDFGDCHRYVCMWMDVWMYVCMYVWPSVLSLSPPTYVPTHLPTYIHTYSSLLAHADSVMGLRFIPGTHCFFTCSKDKVIKYWDADHFEHILTMPGR